MVASSETKTEDVKMSIGKILTSTLLALGTGLPSSVLAQQASGPDFSVPKSGVPEKATPYSPFVNFEAPNRVFWGDSHLHSSYSWDAGLVGNTLGPDEAYRFAKGEQVMASSGQPVKLVRPLDWLVVADHAESLGVAVLIERSDPAILKSEVGKVTHDLYKEGKIYEAFENWGLKVILEGDDPLKDPALTRTIWEEIIDHAENHNTPGQFTALIGYEWSSAPDGNNLHRVVVMRDGAAEAKKVLPFASYVSSILRNCGTGLKPTRKRRAVRCLPSRTAATSQMGRCSLLRRNLENHSIKPTPSGAQNGNLFMK